MPDTLAIKRISASPSALIPLESLRSGGPVYSKLVDISKCIGCKGCEVACKEWNDLKVEQTSNFGSMQSHKDLSSNTWLLMRFNEVEIGDDLSWMIKKDACLHCEEPGCLFACPAPGAIVQYQNGIVDFNQDQCIGCQNCVSGCPFDIPRFDKETKTVAKCNMCIDRVEVGLEPACVKTCPTNAIQWGRRHPHDVCRAAWGPARGLQPPGAPGGQSRAARRAERAATGRVVSTRFRRPVGAGALPRRRPDEPGGRLVISEETEVRRQEKPEDFAIYSVSGLSCCSRGNGRC